MNIDLHIMHYVRYIFGKVYQSALLVVYMYARGASLHKKNIEFGLGEDRTVIRG